MKNEIMKKNVRETWFVVKLVVGLLACSWIAMATIAGSLYLLGVESPTEEVLLKDHNACVQREVAASNENWDLRKQLHVLHMQPESVSVLTVRATELAGHLMECDGEPGAVHCRPSRIPFGTDQAGADGVVSPIVACVYGKCTLVRK